MTNAEIIDVLERAKARIQKGWTRHRYRAPSGNKDTCGVCAMGAVNWALSGDPNTSPHTWQVERHLNWALDHTEYTGIIRFNDAQKSKKPVIALFDRAIAKLKEEAK